MSKVGKTNAGRPRPTKGDILTIQWVARQKQAWQALTDDLTAMDGKKKQGNMSRFARKILFEFMCCHFTEEELSAFGALTSEYRYEPPWRLAQAIDKWNDRYPQKKILTIKK